MIRAAMILSPQVVRRVCQFHCNDYSVEIDHGEETRKIVDSAAVKRRHLLVTVFAIMQPFASS